MARWIAIAVAATLGLMVLYFSWLPDPALGQVHWLPDAVGRWADRHSTLRTGVPLVPLGVLVMVYLLHKRRGLRWWLMAWLGLTLLVLTAEIGQIFIPRRVFDLADVAWGSVGSAVGMVVGGLAVLGFRKGMAIGKK